ncbi:MAG: zinc transport system substrate-binding protein [Actinomycetota bacterium]|jgi:zinc transport system substrate-binding protein|nr:zinc transport system substrate-binding protein [Actinomycetota bacterium]
MRTILIIGTLLIGAATLASCSNDSASNGRTTVVAAFFPLADAARHVGGADVDVVDLTPPGTEPHDLELTPKRLERIQDADVVLVMGGGFQPAIDSAAEKSHGTTVRVLDKLGIDARDPHVWLDPTIYSRIVQIVGTALHAPADRIARYRAQLATLDKRLASVLSTCTTRVMVASHAAYGYLASRYGLRQASITGVIPEGEPDPATLAKLADLVDREHVTTIFTEPLLPRRAARTLARETHARVAALDPLESDAGVGYIEAMDANLRTMASALGCATTSP